MKKNWILNKKSPTVRKAILAALCCVCALSISACGKKDNRNENRDPITGADQSQTNESGSAEGGSEGSSEGGSDTVNGDYSEFDAMIGDESTDPNSIINYINTNIAGAAVSDVKNFFTGLLSFGDDIRNIDFTGLEDSRQYMPEDMIAFMDLMRLEGDTPSMVMSDKENRKVINMTLSEMLERARLFEQHLEKYPNEVSSEAAARMYEEIATNAISGGYNKSEGIEHYYKGDSNDAIDQKALQYYQQFVDANPDSNLAKIVSEYINVLQTNEFKINDSMEEFYRGLQGRFNVSNLKTTGTGAGQSNSTGTADTGNNGAGTGNNGTGTDGTENNSIENSSTESSNVEGANSTNANNTAKK
ncbi:MAG: hypothetical protein K2O91_03060 [Lachnospiraceae bacterium]|nr:hypothetical protein [Lachnospiraceae bacterium]